MKSVTHAPPTGLLVVGRAPLRSLPSAAGRAGVRLKYDCDLPAGAVTFVQHRLPQPTADDVEALLRTTAQRVLRMLARKIGDGDDLATDEALAALEAASLQ